MTNAASIGRFPLARAILASPRLVAVLTQTIIATEVAALFLRSLMGTAGLLAIFSGLVILASLSLLARREEIEWHGLLPVSLLFFIGWAVVSVLWSEYQWASLAGLVYLGQATLLGVYIALNRDTIQIARAFGDVLRVMLCLSIALEIFSGILIDTPLGFLGIAGQIESFGPIQGIFGSRNELGIVAIIALITFATELRTRSIPRGLAGASCALALICLLLARSPIAFGTSLAVAVAAAALFSLRRVPNTARSYVQLALLVVTLASAVIAWVLRASIVAALSASGELAIRLQIWKQVRELIALHSLEGWGWIGGWRALFPYESIVGRTSPLTSALNAFLDVWMQLGLVGLFAFIVLVTLAFVRSWLLASRNNSIVYAWPALILVALITTALGESSILIEFGWMTFVVCTVKASRDLSWRRAFAATDERR